MGQKTEIACSTDRRGSFDWLVSWTKRLNIALFGFAVALISLSSPTEVKAAPITVNLAPSALEDAIDNGPSNGTFDAFINGAGCCSVGNNGFSDIRGAYEFALSSIPTGATIISADLVWLGAVEGTRQINVHGYTGDGAISDVTMMDDSDFTDSTNLVAAFSLVGPAPPGSVNFNVSIDVTSFLASSVASLDSFAGFNVRELMRPPGSPNFTLVRTFDMSLDVTFDQMTAQTMTEPGTFAMLGLGLVGLGLARRNRAT